MEARGVKLVLQGAHGTACQQACLAMLTGVPLAEIISFIGDQRLSYEDRSKVCERYGVELHPGGLASVWMDTYRIGKLNKEHDTLLAAQFDWYDGAFSHCVVIQRGVCYDPALGVNPQWPWTRVIGFCEPVLKAPCG